MKVGQLRINMIRNEAYVDAENAYANIGESIQAVAISHVYRELNISDEDIIFIDQCEIKNYSGEPVVLPLRLPISSDTVDEYFPLPKQIHPIFMSLHLHDDIFYGRQDLVNYFRSYQPIGCRDEYTCNYFRKYGIESYIMGCYTLCLPKREKGATKKIFVVDGSKELVDAIPDNIKKECTFISHATQFAVYPITHEEDARLVDTAKCFLDRYAKEAKLVITSRIHAAAPCIALGIPVILATNNADFRYAWIDKFIPIYQEEDYAHINWYPQVPNIEAVHNLLLGFFKMAVNNQRPDRDILKRLDVLYRDRNKTEYYKSFRNRLVPLKTKFSKNQQFSYAIWGAGCHAMFAHDLMEDMYPNATLKVVVDKYKSGDIFGVPIIKGDKLRDWNIDHVCITTNPGKEEALAECEKLAPGNKEFYTVITSQQKS